MSIADTARANAIPLEVKKDGLQQRQNGDWVLRLVVQAIDMDERITRAAMGTRFQCALVEIGDDEAPVVHQQRETASKPHQPLDDKPTAAGGATIKERKPFDTLLPAQQAALWCKEPVFWKFLSERYPVTWTKFSRDLDDGEVAAAGTVRHLCGVNSRASIKPDNPAWRIILNNYPIWKNHPELT